MFIVFMCTVAPYSDQAEVWVDVFIVFMFTGDTDIYMFIAYTCLCLQMFTCLCLQNVHTSFMHTVAPYSDQAAVSVDMFMFIVYMFMFTDVYMFMFTVYMFVFTECAHILHAHGCALLGPGCCVGGRGEAV